MISKKRPTFPNSKPRKSSKDFPEKKSVDSDPTVAQRQAMERAFTQFTDNRKGVEIYRLRQLLKQLGVEITPEKETHLLGKYRVTKKDYLDFETFYHLFMELTSEEDITDEDAKRSEYADAFIALGGTEDLSGTITKDKIVEVLIHDFELTLDMEKYMQTLGEETKEINFEQFCILLNENANINPSRFSSFLGRRHMSEAVQFFKVLEDEGEAFVDELNDVPDEPDTGVSVKH